MVGGRRGAAPLLPPPRGRDGTLNEKNYLQFNSHDLVGDGAVPESFSLHHVSGREPCIRNLKQIQLVSWELVGNGGMSCSPFSLVTWSGKDETLHKET